MKMLQWGHITITDLPSGLSAHPAVVFVELILLAYFVVVNAIDFGLMAVAAAYLPKFVKMSGSGFSKKIVRRFAMPVSVILPLYNEAEHVRNVVRSIRELEYPDFEIVIVNDGSTDDTLQILKDDLQLVPLAAPTCAGIATKAIRGLYRSKVDPRIRLIDKENGGKADALNAGLNESRYPFIFVGDGDSIYLPDALEQMMRPFAEDARTVGCGAALFIMNGRETVDGKPHAKEISPNLLVRFQIVEYLRAALGARFAAAPTNGLMSVSGACALWKKDVLVAIGGYATNTIWEDVEITMRVHHYLRATRTPYRISFVPASVCGTNVPETLKELRRQRISWQRHITESVTKHRTMLFGSRMGGAGWFAFPAYALTEWLAPVWLLFGLTFVVIAGALNILSLEAQCALLAVAFSLSLLKVAIIFMLDEMSYRAYRLDQVWSLFIAAMLEQIGYRQLVAFWSLMGILAFYRRTPIRGDRNATMSPFEAPFQPQSLS